MNTIKLLFVAISLFGMVSPIPLDAAGSWTLFGLKNEVVNTILPLPPGYGNDAIMVGTIRGIRYHEYSWWDTVWSGLPVYDMKFLPNNRILAAAGNGSDSDGIYIGEVVAIGEPGNLWKFRFLVKCSLPTALEYKESDTGRCSGKLYVGNSSGVSAGLLCDTVVNVFTALGCPAHPWGICASLAVSAIDGSLWAGGNFGFGNSFVGTGEDTALLLTGTTDLVTVKKMNVSSIVEYSSQNDTLLALATIDSGIQVYKKGVYQYSHYLPVRTSGNEPILSIVPVAVQKYNNRTYTALAAATPSGVYIEAPSVDPDWLRISSIPAEPKCLAQQLGTILWAGTYSGVYRYEKSTGVQRELTLPELQPMRLQTIRSRHGSILFNFGDAAQAGSIMNIFDLQGKCIRKNIPIGNSTADIGRGMFLYRIIRNNRTVAAGSFICQ